MKKLIIPIILGLFLLTGQVYAMGPLVATAHIFNWDREADSGGIVINGYYLYWRVVVASGNPNPWVNTQRTPLIPQPAVGIVPSYDPMVLNLPNGNYEWCATAMDQGGDESGPSNIVPLAFTVPAFPMNLRKQ